jgi:hypothetical protein
MTGKMCICMRMHTRFNAMLWKGPIPANVSIRKFGNQNLNFPLTPMLQEEMCFYGQFFSPWMK